MRKIIWITIALLLIASMLNAQGWEKTFDLSFTMTQNAYSDSWTGGEAGNIAWVAKANGLFEKQLGPKFKFRNQTRLAFGQTHIQDNETKNWEKPEKSDDKIDIENLGLFTLDGYVDPYVAVRFQSQFLDASVNYMDRYINPIELTESAGFARRLVKTEKHDLLTRLGGAVKQNISRVIVDSAAQETDWETEIDGGIESVTDAILTFSESLKYVGKLTLYKALLFSDKDKVEGTPREDYWKAIDVNFENSISAQVAKYVTVSLYMQFLYDKQVSVKGRFKETLGLGVTYKMF